MPRPTKACNAALLLACRFLLAVDEAIAIVMRLRQELTGIVDSFDTTLTLIFGLVGLAIQL
jgi:hypothetical protein